MTVEGSCTRSLLVLVVDDEPAVASTLARILCTAGCRVRAFHNGRDLVICRMDEPPDVVITDFVMQPMDGLSVAAWVRREYPRARIIMTTEDEEIVRHAFGQRPPFTVMEKPLNSVRLLAAVYGIDDEDLAESSVA